ncbi:related to gamma-glutamylcysteine synthetase light chain [Phialocephala subalpina]|uniref:GCS light chain n=1 Tax=Phialocephala subalpina TaxID=576137 RepID=A0A1L7WJ15_9HELO|nr:related to gamma-glutamylcysteine synthetase light chain [Phialocephala subalpina]
MTRLILSTSNIMTGGPSIIRKPGADRSNLELTNSLRSNFLAAQQDYSPPLSATNGSSRDSYDEDQPSHRPQASVWTARDGSDYYIPKIDWAISGLAEEPSQYDITVKLFYLKGADIKDRPQHTKDAVNLVLKELGVPAIDLLIVSFPGMSFDGDCEWEADKKNSAQGNDEEEIESWPVLEELHNNGIVKKLGLAEFGSEKLSRFLARVKVRPQVDQVNVKDCCNVPPPLLKLAKMEQIELLTHNDCTDILPSGTLRELLGQGVRGAGILSETKRGLDGMKGDLTPDWVVKYTAVVRDRGVIENKGYFAAAELKEFESED